MRFFLLILLTFQVKIVSSRDNALTQNRITGSILSIRCKELLKERSDKVKNQQKLNALLQRNELLLKKTPESKEIMRAKLNSIQIKLKNELQLTNLTIGSIEETIIRAGCPGLTL